MIEITDRDSIMEQWISWREYIANGGGGSWPRDAFECVLDYYEEKIEKLEKTIEKLKGHNVMKDVNHDIKCPHGTIVCPHCGTVHCGLIDSLLCDGCGRDMFENCIRGRNDTGKTGSNQKA